MKALSEARRGELAVIRIRHSYTAMHGATEASYTFEPVSVESINVGGRVIKVRNAWNSPRKSTEWDTLWTLKGTKAAELLPRLEKEYDSLDEIRQAVRAAMSPTVHAS